MFEQLVQLQNGHYKRNVLIVRSKFITLSYKRYLILEILTKDFKQSPSGEQNKKMKISIKIKIVKILLKLQKYKTKLFF